MGWPGVCIGRRAGRERLPPVSAGFFRHLRDRRYVVHAAGPSRGKCAGELSRQRRQCHDAGQQAARQACWTRRASGRGGQEDPSLRGRSRVRSFSFLLRQERPRRCAASAGGLRGNLPIGIPARLARRYVRSQRDSRRARRLPRRHPYPSRRGKTGCRDQHACRRRIRKSRR